MHTPKNGDPPTIYEFAGCWYHGCAACKKKFNFKDLGGVTHEGRHANFEEKLTYLREHRKFKVIVMWEHEYDGVAKFTAERIRVEKLKKLLSPENGCKVTDRDALNKARKEGFACHFEADDKVDGEEIMYVDYVSLYPNELKKSEYPVGHPVIRDSNCGAYVAGNQSGFVHCKGLAPKNLLIPVLPYKTKDKLMFGVCKKCCDIYETETKECSHTEAKRMFEGMWCTPELDRAVSKGYQVKQVNVVLHYERRMTGMFEKYINMWLKIKAEASGFPASVEKDDQEAVDKFISDYYEAEQISKKKERKTKCSKKFRLTNFKRRIENSGTTFSSRLQDQRG